MISFLGLLTPYFLAAQGGLYSERAGKLNIGLEGLMLLGAFASYLVASLSGSIGLGILLGLLSAIGLSALMAYFVVSLGANLFISGLAVNLLSVGIVSGLSKLVFGNRGTLVLPPELSPDGQNIPIVFFLVGLGLLGLSWYLLEHTRFGLRIKVVGQYPQLASNRGISQAKYSWAGLLTSGLFAGLGGIALMLRQGAFVPNISAGKGWIALVVIFLGFRHPLGILVASMLFAFAESLGIGLQGLVGINDAFFLALPYFLTVFVLIIYQLTHKSLKKLLIRGASLRGEESHAKESSSPEG